MNKDLKFELNYEATIATTPLEEYYYCSPNKLEYLENEHFHNSLKGCDVEMVIKKDGKNLSVNGYCHTHNKLLSKTGWEMGWWGGTNSKAMLDREFVCERCGKELKTHSATIRFCKDCRHIAQIERCRENYLKSCQK